MATTKELQEQIQKAREELALCDRQREMLRLQGGDIRDRIRRLEADLAKSVGILGEGVLTGEDVDHECG